MLLRLLFAVTSCCFALVGDCFAEGMFGLRKGMTKKEVAKVLGKRVQSTDKRYHYEASYTDKELMKDYCPFHFIISPIHGLVAVQVVKDVKTNSKGTQLKAEFDIAKNALTKKYGKGEAYSFLEPRSLWREPNEYMMALKEEDRIEEVVWWSTEPFVWLQALAHSERVGEVFIVYRYDEARKIIEELEEERDNRF